MNGNWMRAAIWICGVGFASAQGIASSAVAQVQADAGAYAGLIGPREKQDKLTQNPRDLTLSVSDTRRSLRFDDPLLALPTHMRMVASAACQADLVVAAEPVGQEPFFNPAETWILTRYRLRVLEVLKAIRPHSEGTPELTYVHPSGSMTIRGRGTSTTVSAYPPLKEGQEYLFFLTRIPASGHYSSALELPVLKGGDEWTAHVGADTIVPGEFRKGLSKGDLLAQVVSANCRGRK